MKYLFFFVLLTFIILPNIDAQNNLLFLNGDQINIDSYLIGQDFNGDSIVTYHRKNKTKEILAEDVFSITDENNNEIILYNKNEDIGYFLEKNEMKSYVIGSSLAKKNFKSPMTTVIGFSAGVTAVVCPFFNKAVPINNFNISLIPLLPSATTFGTFLVSKGYPTNTDINNSYPEYANDEFFIDGYRNAATHKKVKNSILGGISGILVGFAILAL